MSTKRGGKSANRKPPAKKTIRKPAPKQAKPKTAAKKKAAVEPPKFGTPEWREKYAKKKR